MLTKCKECGKDVSDQAGKCPNCGAPVQKAAKPPIAAGVVGFIVLCVIVFAIVHSTCNKAEKAIKDISTSVSQAEHRRAAYKDSLIVQSVCRQMKVDTRGV